MINNSAENSDVRVSDDDEPQLLRLLMTRRRQIAELIESEAQRERSLNNKWMKSRTTLLRASLEVELSLNDVILNELSGGTFRASAKKPHLQSNDVQDSRQMKL